MSFPSPLALWDLQGRPMRTNPSLGRLLGYPPAETEALSIFNFVHPEDRRAAGAEFQKLLRTGEAAAFECRVRCKNGSYRWLLWSAVASAEMGVIYAAAADVTAQKQAEAAARKSEAWLQFTHGAAQLGQCYREDGKTAASEQQFRLYGLEPAATWISREDWLRLIHPEDRERVQTEQRLADSQGRAYDIEFRVVWPDGSIHWLLCRGQVFPGAGGTRKTEITVDVTKRNRAERTLDRAFATTRSPIGIVGFDGYIKRANAALLALSGSCVEELSERPAWEFFHPDDRAAVKAEFDKLIAGAEATEFECRGLRKDGSWVWLILRASALADEKLIYTVAYDITSSKTAAIYRELKDDVLQILNEGAPILDSLRQVVALVKARTGVDAVGIRLNHENDFPYLAQAGFPEDFLLNENSLVTRGDNGEPCRDEDGCVRLECTCGLVISGKTDPSDPVLAPSGTFWTNDSLSILELPADRDPRFRPRNRCFHLGYRSVALTPIRDKSRIVGLLQLNSRAAGFFSPVAIEGIRELAEHVGEAIIRKRAEEALRDSEARLRAITDSARDAIIMMDSRGAVTYWNAAAEAILGYARSEALGKELQLLLAPERYLASYGAALPEFIRAGTGLAVGQTVELEARRKDGREVSVDLSVSAICLKGEWHAVGILRDVTERKRAAMAVAEEAQRRRILFEESRDGIVVFDGSGKVREVNQCFADMLGYGSPEAVLQLHIWDWDEQVTPNRLRSIMQEVKSGKHNPGIIEARLKRRDGSWIDAEISPTVVEIGGEILFYAVHRDVTDRMEAEEALRHSEQRFRLIAETINDVFWIADAASNSVTYVSPAFERVWGRPCEAVYESLMVFVDAIHPEDRPRILADVTACIRTPAPFEHEYRVVRPDGTIAWVLDRGFPVRDKNGHLRCLVGLARDITQRKRMEEALKLHSEKLARSNQELERFAYAASHDLQEPLRMVASFTQLLGQRYSGKLDATADRYINYAVDGARRMQCLITDLLAYSRVNSRELDWKSTPCEEVVARALQNLQVAVTESNAGVTWDPLPTLRADPGQLGQLFQNLLANAIKFRGEAVPQVHISAVDEGQAWVFSIRDNGIGIDPHQCDRIFQIFQRLHGRTEYPGTGIGLAVCKKVVERHGGKIWVESTPGAGSTFRFTLPRMDQRAPGALQYVGTGSETTDE